MTVDSDIEKPGDEALFARISEGDTAAFAAFYDRHQARWFGLILRIVTDPAEAEDVLQDAAVLIWERAPMFDPTHGHPAAWAMTVVRNKAIDRIRAGRRRGSALSRLAEVTGEDNPALPPPGSGAEAWGPDSARLVRNTLERLPAEQRQAIELAFFGGLSQSEISEHLGQPLGTVKARIRRGMSALRDALEGVL